MPSWRRDYPIDYQGHEKDNGYRDANDDQVNVFPHASVAPRIVNTAIPRRACAHIIEPANGRMNLLTMS